MLSTLRERIGLGLSTEEIIKGIEKIERKIVSGSGDNFILTTSSDNRTHKKLFPKDVLVVNSDGRFATFETNTGKTYFYPRISLSKIMESWSNYFVFGGRDKIINFNSINKVYSVKGKNFVKLNYDNLIVEISRRSAKEIKERMKLNQSS